ncbi:MAG: hypothetical protein ACLQMH_15760 [Solirubrobacteraceae bacterium]
MRRGELLGASWRALDLENARLQVDQQLIPTPGGCTFGPPKSKRSERTLALDPATVEALRAHREVQQLERDLAGAAYEDHDLVFCNELGSPIPPKCSRAGSPRRERRQASRQARCTSSATRPPRWR